MAVQAAWLPNPGEQLMDTQIQPSTVRTLEDLSNWILNDPTLTPTRRRDIGSALRSIARLLGRPLAGLPCDLPALRQLLEKIHPTRAGISKKRLQNLRSDLVFAIRHVHASGGQVQPRRPLCADWQQLFQHLNSDNLKNGLSGFLHYCSDQQIGPEAVNDEHAANYFVHLQQHTLRRNPRKSYRNACRLWNQAADQFDGWPNITLLVPSFRKPRWTLPWEELPQSFQDECQRYLNWLAGKDLLNDHQPPKICKSRTVHLRQRHIHLLTSGAIRQGLHAGELISLETLVTRSIMESAIRGYQEKVGQQSTRYLHDLVRTLFAIAKHWVRTDEETLEWLRTIMRRMPQRSPGLTSKNREMLRQFDSEANMQRLLAVPNLLIEQSETIANPARAAVRFQLGVIIEILLMAPMRIGNLASLRIDQHLQRPEGPGGPAVLVLLESETKNSQPVEYPLPHHVVALLDQYLSEHRPLLTSRLDDPWLWPGQSGHKQESRIAQQVKEAIFRETGLHLTVHQFRHLAARLILDEQPGSYELVRQVLGHKNLKTTVNFYAGMRSKAAVAHYDRLIEIKRARGHINP
jgi:integrase